MLTSERPYRSGRRGREPYNQYNLVEMLINDKPMHGRPIEFDSEQTTSDSKNMFGVYVKPTKLSTTCPDCGAGLIVSVKLPDPPFPKIIHTCEHCHQEVVRESNPFVNPLETGRVAEHELDPLLHDGGKILDDNLTVAERMNHPGIPLPSSTISVPYVDFKDPPVVFDPRDESRIGVPEAEDREAAPPPQEEAQEVDLNDILGTEIPVSDEFKETQRRTVETADGISPEDDSDLEDDE